MDRRVLSTSFAAVCPHPHFGFLVEPDAPPKLARCRALIAHLRPASLAPAESCHCTVSAPPEHTLSLTGIEHRTLSPLPQGRLRVGVTSPDHSPGARAHPARPGRGHLGAREALRRPSHTPSSPRFPHWNSALPRLRRRARRAGAMSPLRPPPHSSSSPFRSRR